MNKGKKAAMYIFLTICSLLSVFPLYYMACAATNKSVDVSRGKLIPGTYLVENFKTLIANQDLSRALWNSFRNATVLTLICLLVCSLAGYGFEIYHDKGKDIVFAILLTAMMVPFAAIMIPLFRMFSKLKMVNTMAASIWGFRIIMACISFHQDFVFRSCCRRCAQNIVLDKMMLLRYPGGTIGTKFLAVDKQGGLSVRS